MAHFLGDKGKSSTPTGKDPSDPTPNPSPSFDCGEYASAQDENGEGSSLAVLQFVALIRGEWAVQAPKSLFRVEQVTAEERYCLMCCGVRWHDIVSGQRLAFSDQPKAEMAICRCCGCTGEVCEL